MGRVLHVRLDDETEQMLDRLQRRTGTPVSELVRSGLRLLDRGSPPSRTPDIVGLGQFSSGVGDLASDGGTSRGSARSHTGDAGPA